MTNINWKVRLKNPNFWIGLVGVVISPILAYYGAALPEINTWKELGQIITDTLNNPYLVGSIASSVLGFLGVVNDPTTAGLSDSTRALTYTVPKK